MSYATIFNFKNGHIIADGVQSAVQCDEAIHTARNIARSRGHSVIVEDRGTREHYRVTPAGHQWKVPAGWVSSWDAGDDNDWIPTDEQDDD